MNEDRCKELMALFSVLLIGGVWGQLQAWLFTSGIIPITKIEPAIFVKNEFTPLTLIVWLISAICAIIWYLITLRYWKNYNQNKQKTGFVALWSFLLGICIIGLLMCIYFAEIINYEISIWVISFLIFNLIWTYGFGTAVSTNSTMSSVVPLKFW